MGRRSPLQRAARAMRPDRLLWRVFGPGTAYPSRKRMKAKFAERTVATGSREDYERMLARASRSAKKTAAKKPAAGDVYAAARQIPARNQAAAKKNAATAKKAAPGKKQQHVQGAGGRMHGSVSVSTFGPRERAMYERGLAGYVDPGQQVRQPRRRG